MTKMNIKSDKFSVIILAAGLSERLGFPKLSLQYDENNTFIEEIINQFLDFGCTEVIVVVNEKGRKYVSEKSIKLVINEHPEWHRFYSLKLAIESMLQNNPVFVHNVDNPFVNPEVLNELVKHYKQADYLAPEFEGRGGHPFLLSEKIVNDIRTEDRNQVHLKEFLLQYPKLKIAVKDKNILVNINTEEEYIKYFPSV